MVLTLCPDGVAALRGEEIGCTIYGRSILLAAPWSALVQYFGHPSGYHHVLFRLASPFRADDRTSTESSPSAGGDQGMSGVILVRLAPDDGTGLREALRVFPALPPAHAAAVAGEVGIGGARDRSLSQPDAAGAAQPCGPGESSPRRFLRTVPRSSAAEGRNMPVLRDATWCLLDSLRIPPPSASPSMYRNRRRVPPEDGATPVPRALAALNRSRGYTPDPPRRSSNERDRSRRIFARLDPVGSRGRPRTIHKAPASVSRRGVPDPAPERRQPARGGPRAKTEREIGSPRVRPRVPPRREVLADTRAERSPRVVCRWSVARGASHVHQILNRFLRIQTPPHDRTRQSPFSRSGPLQPSPASSSLALIALVFAEIPLPPISSFPAKILSVPHRVTTIQGPSSAARLQSGRLSAACRHCARVLCCHSDS
ncbi:hypothetical protein THAOC_00597 [Thalassiosira oceanica]|uniref:Uncharacterized protein n=1 Tax=Thalassiosira oceanica TaxID=159749 RepID=K0TK20_THAOC|nr:hypothetical protein THAOC_00597 [Thalassiosira oceanica]|eukprot:EJK77564.1 hypothetical protein THAOC_00597 [Thalassiosira oceanica]